MLMIPCPYCGERDEHEFGYGGEAHIARPDIDAAEKMTDAEWADFVFHRTNTKGVFLERWVHSGGCRKWFNAARNTATNELLCVYKMGEALPADIKPTLQKRPEPWTKALPAPKKTAAAKKKAAPKKAPAKKAAAAKKSAPKKSAPKKSAKKTAALKQQSARAPKKTTGGEA